MSWLCAVCRVLVDAGETRCDLGHSRPKKGSQVKSTASASARPASPDSEIEVVSPPPPPPPPPIRAARAAPAPPRAPALNDSITSLPPSPPRTKRQQRPPSPSDSAEEEEERPPPPSKALLAARAKAASLATEVTRKITVGGFARDEVVLVLPRRMRRGGADAAVGAAWKAALSAGLTEEEGGSGVTASPFCVCDGDEWPPLSTAVSWVRRTVDPRTVETSRGGVKAGASVGFLPGGVVQPYGVRFFTGSEFIATLVSFGTDGLEQEASAVRAALPPGSSVYFLVEDAAGALSDRQKAVGPRGANVSAAEVDAATNFLYLTAGVQVIDVGRAAEVLPYIARICAAVAEAPYRSAPSSLATIVKVRVAKKGGAAAGGAGAPPGAPPGAPASESSDEGGKRPASNVWNAQLQMVPGVSAARAAAIAAAYPTPTSLVAAYRGLPSDAAPLLLAEVVPDAKPQRKMSSNVHAVMTGRDPGVVVGGEATRAPPPPTKKTKGGAGKPEKKAPPVDGPPGGPSIKGKFAT